MFVPPPTTRYPSQAAAASSNGQTPMLMVENNNTLSHPIGPEYQLVVGEGTYILRDDLHIATPPPHPSETHVLAPNPLETTPRPVTAGTKISLLRLDTQSLSPIIAASPSLSLKGISSAENNSEDSPCEIHESAENNSGSSEDSVTSSTGSVKQVLSNGSNPISFGEGNHPLSLSVKESGKKKKPKNNIAKSNSSFISRCVMHENLAKKLNERNLNGYFAFANVNRAFEWFDLSSPQKAEYLTKILFTKSHCLCHDINDVTKSQNHIDIVMGFSTGEIIWYEPISQRYTRMNKKGIINKHAISEIKWIPGSESLFLAAHIDGSLVIYDKEKDDATFMSEGSEKLSGMPTNHECSNVTLLHVDKSVRSKNQKFNPVSLWKLSNQRINAFAFSPDSRHLAVVCEGGTLRIIDYLKKKLLGNFSSYYGGFICVCWSPDGKYILTGGQDDLVSIWSFAESRIVARCQGHQSWVTAVRFDPWRCHESNYRFGSVGEDCRLLLWDFSVGLLHRPKAKTVRLRGSVCSWYPGLYRAETSGSKIRSNSVVSVYDNKEDTMDHPAEARAKTATLPPVMSKVIHDDPLCWLEFTKESILTSCISGHLRTWERPQNTTRRNDAT